jgi:hypothetical protein
MNWNIFSVIFIDSRTVAESNRQKNKLKDGLTTGQIALHNPIKVFFLPLKFYESVNLQNV